MTNKEAADLLDNLFVEWPAFPPPGIEEALSCAIDALVDEEIMRLYSNNHRVDL